MLLNRNSEYLRGDLIIVFQLIMLSENEPNQARHHYTIPLLQLFKIASLLRDFQIRPAGCIYSYSCSHDQARPID